LRARVLARLAENLHFVGDADRAVAMSAEALAIARASGNRRALITALLGRHVALLHVENGDERLELTEELLRVAPARSAVVAETHQWRLYDLLEAGRVEEAREEQSRLEASAEELRLPLFQHVSTARKAVWAQIAGRLEEAEELAQLAFKLGRRARVYDASSILTGMLFAIRREQDRTSELVPRIDALPRGHAAMPVWQTALTLARLDGGDRHGASERYEQMAAPGFRISKDLFWLSTTAMLAETCAALGDAARAPVLYERLKPHAGRLVQVSFAACWGSVERYLGLLAGVAGDADGAVSHAEAAVARNLELEAPLLAARARCDCAAALIARGRPGDADAARDHAQAAMEAARALGAKQLEGLAAASLSGDAPPSG
jgi:tetratricopeptide (TPR) repeat protein